MSPSKELIEALLKKSPNGVVLDIPEYLARELTRVNNLKRRRQNIAGCKHKLRLEYEAALKEEDRLLLQIQVECKHEDLEYHGDPAGGRDSHHECCICGKHI